MTEKNISIPQLAIKIGMTKGGLYSSIEKMTLTVDTLEKIADVLNVPVLSFFEDENEKWTKSALIDEVKKLDEEVETLSRRQDELLEIIRAKRFLIRKIFSDLLEMGRSPNPNAVNEGLNSLLYEIEQFEGFEEQKRLTFKSRDIDLRKGKNPVQES